MAEQNVSVQVGPGGMTLLTILFVLLKVFGYISWSWWWVFSPLWIGAAIVLVIVLFLLAIAILGAMLQ